VTLIGGDPGIGKSTLLLQALAAISASAPVLYVTVKNPRNRLPCVRSASGSPPTRFGCYREPGGDHHRHCPAREAGSHGDRFNPDGVYREPAVGARQRRPGA